MIQLFFSRGYSEWPAIFKIGTCILQIACISSMAFEAGMAVHWQYLRFF
jgi:hypothetical protein